VSGCSTMDNYTPNFVTDLQLPGDGGGREEHATSRGLSTSHIPVAGCAECWANGSLITVKSGRKRPANDGGGIRGLATFSKNSRRRLMQTICKMERGNIPLFVGLTYPSIFPTDPTVYKNHIEYFYDRLERKFKNVGIIWRLEFQKRGAPHFHVFVWGVDYVSLLRVVSRMWYETVGSGDPKHLEAGTRVEKLRSWRGAIGYAGKYLGKIDKTYNGLVGRWWGVKGRVNLPWAVFMVACVSPKNAQTLIRYFRRYAHIKSRAYLGLTVICDAAQWISKIDFLRDADVLGG